MRKSGGDDVGRIFAYLIAGHHAGLPDWLPSDVSKQSALSCRLEDGKEKKYLEEALANNVSKDILSKKKLDTKPIGGSEGLHLWVRMLFSCLVDADFLDTEAFMSSEKAMNRTKWSSVSKLKNNFDSFIKDKLNRAEDLPINRVRARVLKNCLDAAVLEPGVFSLTVPTGGGKTLASMAFALRHAVAHNKRRIIVAIPYTSIIEQTTEQYRKIFGDDVVEHHSNINPEDTYEDTDEDTAKSRLACENWDAPIIVTTNVQLLESLFAAKTSRCRKLHNLVNSVLVIDEAQLLPPEFLQPVLDVLRLLTKYYGMTLLLSTATQPVLSTVQDIFGKTKLRGLDKAREIIHDVAGIYQELNRVEVTVPSSMNQRSNWEDIANALIQHEKVLAIVNTRKNCRELFNLMPKGTIHLSGLMCGQHRSEVINSIKKKLRTGEVVRVISTQLVESGVDIDFPVVYRALAGLDSIAQAAGRCNREGKLMNKGQVIVFVPPHASPKGMLLFGEEATRSVWYNYSGDPLSCELFKNYFSQYFNKCDHDKHGIISLLTKDAVKGVIQFRSAADKFKIIDEQGMQQILVPYGAEGQKWLDILRSSGPERYLLRKLQRYSVTVYKAEFEKMKSEPLQLMQIFDPKQDSLRFYFLGKKGRQKVEHVGAKLVPDVLRDALIL